VSFSTLTLCVASRRVFIVVSVYFVMTQSGNFWIHPRIWEDNIRMDAGVIWWRDVVKTVLSLRFP
jgi:hypothetical protein